jgi:hypothetical protein
MQSSFKSKGKIAWKTGWVSPDWWGLVGQIRPTILSYSTGRPPGDVLGNLLEKGNSSCMSFGLAVKSAIRDFLFTFSCQMNKK